MERKYTGRDFCPVFGISLVDQKQQRGDQIDNHHEPDSSCDANTSGCDE